MSNNIIDQAEQSINSYQAKTGTSRQSDSGTSSLYSLIRLELTSSKRVWCQ